jgi:hypothetical protein
MSSLRFWQAVVQDKSDFLPRVTSMLEESGVRYCVIGGFGVNAYSDTFIVTEDLDIIVAVEDLERVRALFEEHFRVREFEHSLNVYDPDSKMQVQVQLHPDVSDAESRAERRELAELYLPVAAPPDLMKLKVAAALEPRRRTSKRQKDLADIQRLIEAFPDLRDDVPAEIADRLLP